MLVSADTLVTGDTVFSKIGDTRYYYTIKRIITTNSEGEPVFGVVLDVLDMRGRIIRAYLSKNTMINILKS